MDGVPYVTQDPIPPGGFMVYNFTVDDPGTFWYHSHHLEQYVDGVSGALIVRDDSTEKLLYSDRILFMKDFYPKLAKTYLSWFFSLESGGEEPLPTNGLINGLTQDADCLRTKTCQYPTVRATRFTNYCGKYITWPKILSEVEEGKYAKGEENRLTRLRVIAGTALVNFDVSVDNHYMWVLALDGQPIEPRRVTSFRINGGQRVDVALCNMLRIGPTANKPAFIRSQLIYNAAPEDLAEAGVNPGAMGILYYPESVTTYDAGAPQVSRPADTQATTNILTMTPSIWASHLPVSGSPNITYGDGGLPYDFVKEPVGLTTGENADKYPVPEATKEITIALNSYNDTQTKFIYLTFNRLSWVFPKKTLLDYVQPGACARRMEELRPWYESFHQQAVAEGHRGLQVGLFEEEQDDMCECMVQRRLDLGPEEAQAQAQTPAARALAEEEERALEDEAICRCSLQRRLAEAEAEAAVAAVASKKGQGHKNFRVLEDYGDESTSTSDSSSSSSSSSSSPSSPTTCRRFLLEPETQTESATAGHPYRVLEDYGDGTDAAAATTTTTTTSSNCKCNRPTRARYLVGEEYDDEIGLPKWANDETPTGGANPNGLMCKCLMNRRALRTQQRKLAAVPRVSVDEVEGVTRVTQITQPFDRTNEADRQLAAQSEMQGMHVMTYHTGEVIQIVLNNYDPGEHPIHIHGRRFYVLGRGAANVGEFNPNRNRLNVKNPYLRDTVTIEARSWIVIRFADQNPGVWMMHCHIDWHQRQGLGMVFNELPTPVIPPSVVKPALPTPVGLIVGLVFGAVGALAIAAFLAYRMLPDLFHFSNPFQRKTAAEDESAALGVPLLLFPPGSAPPPPPPLTSQAVSVQPHTAYVEAEKVPVW